MKIFKSQEIPMRYIFQETVNDFPLIEENIIKENRKNFMIGFKAMTSISSVLFIVFKVLGRSL